MYMNHQCHEAEAEAAEACITNKLAFAFFATSAAPTSPNVFDTELPI
jgi:hypothetical protein